jgi:predicted alpha/beta-hydrolase family hydrolase
VPPEPHTIETPHGPARVYLHPVADPAGAIVLGHGAGGSVTAPDLVAVTGAAREAGLSVVLVEQPYRVAGRRSAAPAHQLDAAWTTVVEALRADALRGLPLVTGGRSSGARVACRTADAVGAAAVLCLAFPVHPPGKPEKTRQPELDLVRVPTLVVQGESDPFGRPEPGVNRAVALVRGNHSLKGDLAAVAAAVGAWLPGVLGAAR